MRELTCAFEHLAWLLPLLLWQTQLQHCSALGLLNGVRPNSTQARAAWFLPEGYVKSSADILKQYRYPSEAYNVLTEDGFVLQLDRIPNPGRFPVYLANPILSSALVYLYQGPRISLGFLLYDAGFDVWLGNFRGTVYSRDSMKYTENDDEYWKFSFHEHGVYDNTACINFILKTTQRADLGYIGYSMGSTTFLTMASMRPEFNAKVRFAFLMAPVAALYNSPNSLARLLGPIHNASEVIGDRLSIHFFPHGLFRLFSENFCPPTMGIICNEVLWFLFDSVRRDDYVANCPDLSSTWPAGGSLQTLWHYVQQADAPGRFRLYNYAPEKNLALYGRLTPPDYPLHRISTPIYIYLGSSDTLITPQDFAFLQSRVKSIEKVYRHPDPLFTHADFVFAKSARILNVDLINDLKAVLQGPQ